MAEAEARLETYLHTQQQRFTAPEGAVAASGLHSGSAGPNGWQTTTIRDQDAQPRPAGAHQLSVHCTGTGSLTVTLAIGESSESTQLPQCSPETAATTLSVRTTTQATPTTVTIAPAPGTVAAIAYALT
ncbi:hypothetical protein [Kineococcus sp. SYSU DK018]|uniref:hypothetical protein n=1 Tax=Kineococcus sp. SYSU DK018 TaxID=3383139 RepID=UPI003D7C6ED4